MHINRTSVFISICLLVGFVYRLFLSSFAFPEILYDVSSYSRMAEEVLAGKLTIDCCDHNPGYGILLGGVYAIFGLHNLTAVRVIQSLLDIGTALLLYCTAVSAINKRTAMFVLLLYLINPFTASYAGLRLSEIWTLFIVSVLAWIISRKRFAENPHLWFACGFTLGLLLLTRASAQTLVAAFFFYLTVMYFRGARRWRFLMIAVSGWIIPCSYLIIANYYHFQKISLTPPYNMGQAMLYWNFYNDRYPELTDRYFETVNPEFYRILLEFHRTYYTDVPAFKARYKVLFREKLREEWPLFVRNTLRNILWMWDKNHLYYYADPWYPADERPLQILNATVLAGFFLGIGSFVKTKGRAALRSPLFVFTVVFFLVITGLYTLVSNETRHSLSFYGLLCFWAGYGLNSVSENFSTRRT